MRRIHMVWAALAVVCLTLNGLLVSWGFGWLDAPGAGTPRLRLHPEQVHLGELRVGERRTFRVEVENESKRPLRLDEPETQCGCLSVVRRPVTLEAGEVRELVFEIEAPTEPVPFEKEILLRAADHSAAVWKIGVKGTTAAQVWSTPALVTIALDAAGHGNETGVIRFAEAVPAMRAVATDPEHMAVHLLDPGTSAQAFSVEIHSEQSGEGKIHFFSAEGDKQLISVPVRWKRRQLIACYPATLQFDAARESSGEISLSLTVVKANEAQDRPLTVSSTVPWLRVGAITERSARLMQVELIADRSALPEGYTGKVLQLQVDGEPEAVYVQADIP